MWELGESLALWLFEQGVDVDACSRSLREGWLERGLSGVRMLALPETSGEAGRKARATNTPPSAQIEHPVPTDGRLHVWSRQTTAQRAGNDTGRGTLSKTKKTMLGAFAVPILTYAMWTFAPPKSAQGFGTKQATESRIELPLPVGPARTSAATAAMPPIAATFRMDDVEREPAVAAATSPRTEIPHGSPAVAPGNPTRVTKLKRRAPAKPTAVDPEFGF